MNWYEAMVEARKHGISREALAGALQTDPEMLARWEEEERPVSPAEKGAFDSAIRRLGESAN